MADDPVSGQVRWDRPWPGLAAYEEGSREFFHGRDGEAAELLRLVGVAPLTVLYGRSGLGKTSLLLAGLFPRLRDAHYLPVHLRLDFSEGAVVAPLEQAMRRLQEEILRSGAEAPERKTDDDLWRYLHRRDFELWSTDNFPLIPVLVFDQFEEIFSHGGRREHIGAIFDALADLIENRIPVALSSRDTDRDEQRRYDLRTQRYRVILSFREDFLPEFDGWKDKVPSLLINRLRLLPMSREQAIRAVELAGREVLADGVAPRIVDFVTRGEMAGEHGGGSREPTVEPVLLSLCCTRLNQRREPDSKIDAALVDSAGKDILEAFYREAVGDMPARVQLFIEAHLIQGDRYRGSYPRDEALAAELLTQAELDALTNVYRLLRIDQQADTARIELIHDRMVEVVRTSRDERRAREATEQALRVQQQARQEAERERQRREEAEGARAYAEAERARAEREKGRAERQRTRANRMSLLFGAGCVLLAIGAAAFWQAKSSAVEAGRRADVSRLQALEARLVGEATAMLSGGRAERPDRVLLQLMAARHLGVDTEAVEGAMLKELLLRPQLLKLIPTEESVSGLVFIANGTKLVSTSGSDGSLRIYDSASGKLLDMSVAAHRGWIWAIAVSPDGKRLVSAGEDGALQMWDIGVDERPDADADEVLRPRGNPMTGHAARVKALAYSPTGDYIVSGSDDKTLRLWDGRTGEDRGALLDEHNGPVNAVAFSPDGSRVVSGSDDATLRLWDVGSRWQIGEPLRGHEAAVRSVAFSPDGRRIVSASQDRTLIRWNERTGEPVQSESGSAPEPPRGRFEGEAMRVERRGHPEEQAERARLYGHSGGICCVRYLPAAAGADANAEFVSGAWDGELRLWQGSSGAAAGKSLSAYSRGLQSIAVAPDGRIASGSEGGGIAIWDPKASASETLAEHEKLVTSVAFSDAGNRLASTAWDGAVRVWDVASGEFRLLVEFDAGAMVWSVALSPDGTRLAAGMDDGAVRLWDIPGRRFIRAFEKLHRSIVWSLAFSPDGKRLASASQDETVRLWDAGSGKALGSALLGHHAGVNSVAFGPRGERLVSGGDDHSVRVWQIDTGTQTRLKPMLHEGPVLAVAFSHDGTRIVSGGADGKLRQWDTVSGELLDGPEHEPLVFTDRGGKVTSLAFSADDRRIVSGSADGALRQWAARPDRTRSRAIDAWFKGHHGRVNSVAISPDGRSIVSGGSDRTVRLWPGPNAWPEQVCAKLTRNMSHREWRELVSTDDPYRCQCPGLPIPADIAGEAVPAEACADPAAGASAPPRAAS